MSNAASQAIMVHTALVIALVTLGSPATARMLLARPALERLPTGAVTPEGWLLRQLVIQAEGLSGHLTKFWPKVRNSAWFGGDVPNYNNECGAAPCPFNLTQSALLHQEAPYWFVYLIITEQLTHSRTLVTGEFRLKCNVQCKAGPASVVIHA